MLPQRGVQPTLRPAISVLMPPAGSWGPAMEIHSDPAPSEGYALHSEP